MGGTGMREEAKEYKGSRIVVRTPEPDEASEARPEEPQPESGPQPGSSALYVDDQLIPTRADTPGRHWTRFLPYEEFDSLTSLGEAVVDHAYELAVGKKRGE
ncbi:MAG TPA: hypothetical protein VGR21_02460 [Cryptosporangiaceae bacterium]|nr:hypothetical protein [Cryptosporangiaceae bacterium]